MVEPATAEITENLNIEEDVQENGLKIEGDGSSPSFQQPNAAGFVVVRIFGTFQASQLAQRRIQALVIQSIRGYNPLDNQLAMGHRNSLNNITNHQVTNTSSLILYTAMYHWSNIL